VIVTRFAPAPTGSLHLGHVLNAVFVWGLARAAGGRVLLRIEDHDRQRSRREHERAILDDLDWLGFVPDAPATAAFRAGACEGRQSDRGRVYEDALAALRAVGLIYACDCSRKQIAAGDPAHDGEELRYPGTCGRREVPERPDTGLRVRLPPLAVSFDDLLHGPQVQRPAEQCGDLLVRDRDGNWTYQFAVTIDDWRQGITLVVRGDDLLPSTGRQLQLAALAGRTDRPRFLHHPLIMKSALVKLSKSDGDSGVGELRARGWTAADVIGHAAWQGRLTATAQACDAREVHRLPALQALADAICS
jgi:glutamyl-tRNA synthetase/glutamyl-Q tRNA(Asp) synthetase